MDPARQLASSNEAADRVLMVTACRFGVPKRQRRRNAEEILAVAEKREPVAMKYKEE